MISLYAGPADAERVLLLFFLAAGSLPSWVEGVDVVLDPVLDLGELLGDT